MNIQYIALYCWKPDIQGFCAFARENSRLPDIMVVDRESRSLTQLNVQVAKLQSQVEAIRAKEVVGVVARIKEAIQHYGLTAADLGFSGRATKAVKVAGKVTVKKARKKATKKPAGVIRYRGEAGQSWTGHGKRPGWFLAAIESGMKPEELEVN